MCFFKVLKSGDSEPGTPLERSGSKFRFKSRARELRSIYGDPFGAKFVLNWRGQGSGATRSLLGPGARTGLSVGASLESDIFRAGLSYDD